MATKYELPEEANAKLLSNLGEEVEMKTFKTNVRSTLEYDENQRLLIKILCLGDYTGGVGSVSPQSRSLFSASFHTSTLKFHTFCFTARAYLNTQKCVLFCSLAVYTVKEIFFSRIP